MRWTSPNRALCGLMSVFISVSAAAPLHETPGDAYRRGDFARTIELLKPPAQSGDVNAQIMLGQMYLKGEGVPVSETRAVEWIRKAADVGSPIAAYDLGQFSVAGIGGPQDYAAAAAWFRRSAHLGYADAAFNLAVLYHKGSGVEHSNAMALRWIIAGASYRLSVGNRDLRPQFAALRDKVLGSMTAEEVRAVDDVSSPQGPMGVAVLRNQVELEKLGAKSYPVGLSHLGYGGHVVALILVRADGTIAETRIEGPSGYPQLDALTSRLLAGAIAVPMVRNAEPVESWQLLQWHWSSTEEPWDSFGKLNAMRPRVMR